jgi:hypothetical protein
VPTSTTASSGAGPAGLRLQTLERGLDVLELLADGTPRPVLDIAGAATWSAPRTGGTRSVWRWPAWPARSAAS